MSWLRLLAFNLLSLIRRRLVDKDRLPRSWRDTQKLIEMRLLTSRRVFHDDSKLLKS